MDITEFPTDMLLQDKNTSVFDIELCEMALANNITEYGNAEQVAWRLSSNRKIVGVIDAELKRRGIQE